MPPVDTHGGVRFGDVNQDQKAGLPFDQGADRGAVAFAHDQTSLPVPGLAAIGDRGRAGVDHRHRGQPTPDESSLWTAAGDVFAGRVSGVCGS